MTNDELADDLDAYVLGDDELYPPDEDETIAPPPDAEHADALARVLRGVEREIRRIDMLATQETSRIESWRSDRLSGLTRRKASLESAIEQWMRAVNRVNPKRKTEHLPHAKVSLRAARRTTVVHDAPAFMAWWRERVTSDVAVYLHDHVLAPDDDGAPALAAEVVEIVLSRSPLVKIKPEPSKTGIAEAAVEGDTVPGAVVARQSGDETVPYVAAVIDGEAVPGVAFAKPTDDSFSVTV